MKNYLYVFALLAFLNCSKETNAESSNLDSIPIENSTSDIVKDSSSSSLTKEETLKLLNSHILKTLEAQDMEQFSTFIHPEKGILFSMYGYVQPEKDKHFTKADFQKYAHSNVKFTWGEKDGTGDLLVLPIKIYLSEWVYKRNYRAGDYLLNTFKGSGNSINNLKEIFPGADFTENYIEGSAEYAEMDWNSLRLVFEKDGDHYYLVAVINDSWTV